ncbi:sporulation protein Spo0E [Brevibacillus laterosporus]|uniref:Spo0E family sporulation regulatory protein-aspartic acid phosphatase n=1 Tax=Brevibacillus laterosporus TaxID=1465 RepID=UPI000CE49524|nr:Spo0E family sporulation regulatory protein-aspartic acid phosphatase [Brevibacillus laterosporus]PPA80758.1 sporulation protein Spo0E [Brevibacillus laterosporus]
MNDLQQTVEDLQQQLVDLYHTEGSFSSPAILQLNQQLDEYIVVIQKCKIAL